MYNLGDLVTWKIEEQLEWAKPPIGVVISISRRKDLRTHGYSSWYKVVFTNGYRQGQTFEITRKHIRRITYEK